MTVADGLVGIDEIREAARGLVGVAVRTPLLPVPALSEMAGFPVFLKLENRQPTGAFKLRGAWTALRLMPEAVRRVGVITYSSGNHGQAVAFAAFRLGVSATIVMPETTPEAKVRGVRKWGGDVVLAGTTSDDRRAKAEELIAHHGLAVVPPFDHPHVIAGQGTVGLEIVDDLPEVTDVLVPVGGGGLLAGVTTALAHVLGGAQVTGVEPEGAAVLAASLAAGDRVRLDHTASVADGLLPLQLGALPWAHVRDRAHSVVVTDDAIREAARWLHAEAGVLAEPSGAVTTAAIRSGAFRPRGPTVLIVSGGNVDPTTL
jgi:threonine dehydratase